MENELQSTSFFDTISHEMRYKFCSGYQVVTLTSSQQNKIQPYYDYKVQSPTQVYTTVCTHFGETCDPNSEFEFFFRNLVIKKKLTFQELQYLRPYHWTSPRGHRNRPFYSDESFFNLNTKCANFKVLLNDSLPVYSSDGFPVTTPCHHTDSDGCQYAATSLYTFARLIKSNPKYKKDYFHIINNSWVATINDCIKSGGKAEDIYCNRNLWPQSESILWSPDNLFDLEGKSSRFVNPPYGSYSYYTYYNDVIDEYGLLVPHDYYDQAYKLEYQCSVLHFKNSVMPNKIATEQELEEIFSELGTFFDTSDDEFANEFQKSLRLL